jgi:hypothetical protein
MFCGALGALLYGGADELVPVTAYLALKDVTEALRHEGILYLHPTADHWTFTSFDDWRKEAAWMAGRTLQKQPRQVTYRTNSKKAQLGYF